MMKTNPITPPPELIEEWWGDKPSGTSIARLATQAAQWGADQELEACVEWLDRNSPVIGGFHLRIDRRPKPPSLKERALSELEEIMTELHDETGSAFTASAIRRALEALDD